MKRFFIAVLILCSFAGFSQNATTYGNFKIAEQQLIYQKVFFEDSITAIKLVEYYSTAPSISDVTQAGDEVKFKINGLSVDYLKFQFSQVSTAQIIQSGKFSGDVSVDVKDGKYRVTVSNILFTGNLGYKRITTREALTNYACRNSGTYISQDWTKPNTLGLLDKALTDRLQYVAKENKKGDGDW